MKRLPGKVKQKQWLLLHKWAKHHIANYLLALWADYHGPDPVSFAWRKALDGAAAGGAKRLHPHAILFQRILRVVEAITGSAFLAVYPYIQLAGVYTVINSQVRRRRQHYALALPSQG